MKKMRSPPTDHHAPSSFLTTRYAPPPPFSGDPDFRPSPHHHHHHLPPPPPPHQPLPPPPAYRTNPAPPPPQQSPHPYNLHHPPQFNFPPSNPSPNRPIQDGSPRSFHHRLAFQDDRPARHLAPGPDRLYPDNRPDSWVVADNRSARPYPPVESDRGSQQHRSFVQRPSPPSRRVEVFRHEPEGSSRFREEQRDQHSQREKYGLVWGRNDGQRRGSNSDRSGRSFGFNNEQNSSSTRGAEHNSSSTRGAEHSSSSRGIQPNYPSRGVEFSSSWRGFESKSASYDSRYGLTSESELGRGSRAIYQRWVQSRQSLKDGRDPSFNMVNSEVSAGDGGRIFSRKEEYNASESGRYMENSHEYVERPRKQVQKKSALLRIQMVKPNHKNVDSEHSQYSDYFGDSNSNSFRGKDQLSYSGHGREKEEEEREGSPVELDVSFKSNSLVAKAIVTPPSSKVPSDTNVTPSNRKIRKVTASDRDCLSSILNKFEEDASRLDSARSVVNNTPSSGRDLKQPEKKVTNSGSVNKRANAVSAKTYSPKIATSQPCCDGMNNLVAKAQVEGSLTEMKTDKSGANAVSAKTSSPRIVKRKKVVKKIIRKVIKPSSRLSTSQLAKKGEEPIKADSSIASGSNQHLKDSKEDQLCAGMTSTHNVDVMQPGLNKITVSSEGNKVGDSPQVIVSQELYNVANSVGRTVDVLPSSLASSSHEIKIYEDRTIADASGHHLHGILNSHINLLKSPIETTCSDAHTVEGVGKQISDMGDSILLENGGEKESQDILFSAEGNAISGLSCSGDKKFNSAVMNTYTPAHEMKKDLEFDIGLVSLPGKTAHSDSGPNVNQQLCTNDAPTIRENDSVEALRKSIASIGIRDIIAASSSVETTTHSEPINADCSEQGRDTMSGPENGWISLEKIATSNNGIHDVCKQTFPSVVTPSLENDAMKGSPNTKVSEVGRDIDTSKSKKRKLKSSQFDLSSSSIMDEDAGFLNLVSPVQAVDPTLILSSKDSNPAEVTVSGSESLVIDLQPFTSGVNVLNGNTTNGSFSEVPVESDGSVDRNVSSPKYKNKRKFSALHRGLSGKEESLNVNSSKPGKEVRSEGHNGPKQQEEKVAASGIIDDSCTAGLPPSWKGVTSLLEPNMSGGDFGVVSPVRDASGDDSSKIELLNSAPCFAVQEMAIPIPNLQSVCPPVFGENEEENDNLITAINKHENMDVESCRRDQLNVHCGEEQVVMCKETQPRISLVLQSPGIDEGFPSTDMERDSCPQVKDYLVDVPNCPSLYVEEDGISTSNSNDEPMESGPGLPSNVCSPETVTDVMAIPTLKCKASFDEHAGEKVSGSDRELAQNPLVEGPNITTTSSSFSKQTQIASSNSYNGTATARSITLKTTPLQSQNCKKMSHHQNPLGAEPYPRKSQGCKTIPRTLVGHPFAYTNSKKTVSSIPVTKPRTWHRNTTTSIPSLPPNKSFSNIVSQQRQLSEKNGKFQSTSYIRKGNSLVRQPTPVAVLAQGSDVSSTTRLNSSSIDDSKKGSGSDRVDVIDPSNVLGTGSNVLSEIPGTYTVPSSTRLPNLSTTSSGTCTLSTSTEPDLSGCCESLSDPTKFTEPDLMKSGTPEDQSGPISNVGSQSENMKRITYVKRKSNQLVAASNTFDIADKTQVLYTDGYYKRRKNQLIRTPLESQKKADDSSNSEGKKASKVISTRSPSKKQSLKVAAKTSKRSKFSLVWTLRGTQTSSKDGGLLHRQFLPYTPYKRASWRSFIQNSAAVSNSSSLSLTRKLLLSRKMNTVYTRSKHGFSLRKSKVLSVGGSSLKWSKSIERQAKMVNEKATLAVAAADKKKREQNGAVACALTRTKNKRQRIFRIGSVRYKMDSSRRTLQRISDDESSHVTASQSKNILKKSYVPRRLLIDNDEYVRIGNGNQLVRDPKKRTRALASEKVRWSLHTARSRLARKRKYCLFFTRFGKCNKDDGKCPYIHDPSKIAVCTKFLNGFCSDPNCKLTHEVIPERMPDCSYFLQGLCTSEKCPYRHVNVNHNAPTCEGFLKGYCVDGDECRKKHSYICPDYESTGSCLQGSKCKLHHPKNRGKGKKRKQSDQQKNARGRYFGFTCNSSETGTTTMSERHAQTNDVILFEGKFGDYISLGASDDEAGEGNNLTNSAYCNSSSSDLQLQDLDSLIKPIRIMT